MVEMAALFVQKYRWSRHMIAVVAFLASHT